MTISVFITTDYQEAEYISQLLKTQNINNNICEQDIQLDNLETEKGYAIFTDIEHEFLAFDIIDRYLLDNAPN